MQTPHRILIVDDDTSLRNLLIEYFTRNGLRPKGAANAAEAREAVKHTAFDVVLLDLGLPDDDGLNLAREWREQGSMAIICITARGEEADRVMGLELGADDYVIKPFSLREMLARVRALMRRVGGPTGTPVTRGKHPRAYRFGDWELNLNMRKLMRDGEEPVPVTNAEFNLLALFLASPKQIITRQQALEATRAFDDVYDRAVDVQILRLRRKIEDDPRAPRLIRTERGVGYSFNANPEAIW